MIIKYECRFIDKDKDYEIVTEEGIVGASSYPEAMTTISKYYGDDNIMGLELDAFEDPILKEDISDELFDQYRKETL